MTVVKKSVSPKIKHLKLNPLSVAKFFYETIGERALDPAFIQPAIYLCYNELKKKDLLLFEEKFKTSEQTPFLLSLDKLLESESKSRKELSKTKNINNSLVIKYLNNFARKYNSAFACELQFKANRSNGVRRATAR